jgi:hypothetical protein
MERFQGTGEFGYRYDFDTGPIQSLDNESLVLDEFRDESVRAVVTPVHFTFYITDNTRPAKPYIGFGVGYYSASYRSVTNYDMTSNFYMDLDKMTNGNAVRFADQDSSLAGRTKMTAGAVGLHAVIGTEYFLSTKLAFLAEIKGRYAKISGFTGSTTYSVNGGGSVTEKGELIAVTEYPPGTIERHVVELDTRSEPHQLDTFTSQGIARSAAIDFSGVSLRLGMAYHF